ncbi:glycosyl hydrolase family 18 protein [Clostridiisalibacter paucivorans]|uniref:glycosyl hydrolase family 18 protein n=1 Tax=Clostridiisalibacter paucivorans TaxID=408753 RepID=UPI000688B0DA|nr:glycosyl hydrolase family 18 protein [Clostridiisalibacter paucivorans]
MEEIIYTVQPGDTLYLIARKYNTTIEAIMKLNNLSNTMLMVGQKLMIPLYSEVMVDRERVNIRVGPATTYPVMTQMVRGALLPVISDTNNWYKVRLYDGREGWVYKELVDFRTYGGEKPISDILGYYTLEEGPTLPSSYESFVNNPQLISQVAPFLFRISLENPTRIEKFGEFTDEYLKEIVDIAHNNNIKVLPVIHNLLYSGGDTNISKQVVSVLVSDRLNRQAFIANTIELIEKYGADGVNIDIEDVYLKDSDNLSKLFQELGEALRKRGYYLSASIPSRVSDEPFNPFSDPFDYEVIGDAVDEFVVMLYNEHGWPGSGPGPVVSIGWMDRVLDYTVTKMPKEKIMAAVSVFGFDFNVTTGRNSYITYEGAMALADKYGKTIMFDENTKTPMFSYVDEQGNYHEVWFENAQSIYEKIKLAWDYGIKGVALWRLGMEDNNIWNMLDEDVVVSR